MNRERHNGLIGSVYRVNARIVEESKTRRGSGDFPILQLGDVLIRTAHSGDCFCDYAVYRNNKKLPNLWRGYDMFREEDRIGNIVYDTLSSGELPGRYR